MNSDIAQTLSDYITHEILKRSNAQLDRADPLISSGLIDSFHLVDLSIFIEETYNVKIDDTELNAETFDTLDELADFILQKAKLA